MKKSGPEQEINQRVVDEMALLTPQEVCGILRISRSTLDTLMAKKLLCPVVVGGRYKIARSHLSAYIESQQQEGEEDAT